MHSKTTRTAASAAARGKRRSAVGRVAMMFGLMALGSLAAPVASWAQDQESVVVSGGGELDVASFGYLSATAALPGSQIGTGLAIRGSGFGGDYSYRGGPLHSRIDAQFGGGEVDAVYQITSGGLWINGVVGGRYVDTHFSPNDLGNRRRGSQGEVALGVDGGDVAGPWRTDWYGSYGTRLNDYEARLSLTHAIGGHMRLGAEADVEGDPTYNQERIGPYLGVGLGKNAEVQLSAGFSEGSARPAGGYLRMGFYHGF
jgi:hypothetical protein